MLDNSKLVLRRKQNIKIDEHQIKEMIFSIVKGVLEEELGISKEAYNESIKTFNYIKELISNKSNYKFYSINNVNIYGIEDNGYFELFNGEYTLKYCFEIIFLDNEEMYNKINKSIVIDYSGFNQDNNFLHIRFPIILSDNDVVSMDNSTSDVLYKTLQHEYKHIYQEYMISRKGKKHQLSQLKDGEVYQKTTEWLYSNPYKGDNLSNIFWAIYSLTPTEITANIQSLYAEIKEKAKTKKDAINVLNNSTFMGELKIYSNLLDNLNNNKVKLSDLMTVQFRLKRNKEWVIKYITKGVKKMKQNIRKLVALIDKEFVE